MNSPMIPVSIGELIDKITILKIKQKQIKDSDKLSNILYELNLLEKIKYDLQLNRLDLLEQQLYDVNSRLWNIENFKRSCEKEQNFDDEFIRAARSVYQLNDLRAAIKREINQITDSKIVEEKQHL